MPPHPRTPLTLHRRSHQIYETVSKPSATLKAAHNIDVERTRRQLLLPVHSTAAAATAAATPPGRRALPLRRCSWCCGCGRAGRANFRGRSDSRSRPSLGIACLISAIEQIKNAVYDIVAVDGVRLAHCERGSSRGWGTKVLCPVGARWCSTVKVLADYRPSSMQHAGRKTPARICSSSTPARHCASSLSLLARSGFFDAHAHCMHI